MSHTPGPWEYSTKKYTTIGSNGKPVRFYGEGITIAMSEPSGEERANWILAKAAPELLGALKSLRDTSRHFSGLHTSAYLSESRYRHESWEALMNSICAANDLIAKAEGK